MVHHHSFVTHRHSSTLSISRFVVIFSCRILFLYSLLLSICATLSPSFLTKYMIISRTCIRLWYITIDLDRRPDCSGERLLPKISVYSNGFAGRNCCHTVKPPSNYSNQALDQGLGTSKSIYSRRMPKILQENPHPSRSCWLQSAYLGFILYGEHLRA